jgi:hypothetical protein
MRTISVLSADVSSSSSVNKSESGVKIMLRVLNGESLESGDIVPEYLKTQINFDSNESDNFQTVKSETGETQYCMYSKPAYFVAEKDSTKIIDLIVITDNEEVTRTEYKRKKEQAFEIRETAKKWVEEAVIPKLRNIQNVFAAIGRGDVFDSDRLPGAESDIDIMLFVDFSSEDKETAQKFKLQMDSSFGSKDGASFRAMFVPIFETGLNGAKEEDFISLQNDGNIRVGFDVISFPDFKRMVEGLDKEILKQLVHRYEAKSLIDGEILLNKSKGELEKIIKIFAEKYGTDFA